MVGTGCSAAQFVPRLTKEYNAKSVTQLMRSPPWVVPRAQPPLGQEKWEKWGPWLNTNVPGFNRALRFVLFLGTEYDWRLFGSEEYNEKERKKLEDRLLAHMRKTVPPKYHDILTPNYDVVSWSFHHPLASRASFLQMMLQKPSNKLVLLYSIKDLNEY